LLKRQNIMQSNSISKDQKSNRTRILFFHFPFSIYLLPFSLFLLYSCHEETKKDKPIKWTNENSTNMHKTLAAEEEVDIKLFLAQHGDWKMTKTGSGLQYYIYENGDGIQPNDGDRAEIEFSISLLDGTQCYKTNTDEVQEFIVDHSEIESGIQEGVKLLHKGDRVKFIIPSHLAHGLVGDMNKIPPLTPIVVDFYLRDIL